MGDIERQVSAHLTDCLAEEGLTIPSDKHDNLVRTLIEMTTKIAGRDDKANGLNSLNDVIRPLAAG